MSAAGRLDAASTNSMPRQELLVGLLGHGGLGHGARGEERLAVDPEMDKAAGGH